MFEKDNKFKKSTPCGIHTQLKDGETSWNRSDMHLAAWDVRRCSFESLLQE